MLAYLMLFAALFNADYFYNACFLPVIFRMLFVFMICLGLLTHSLFISILFCIMHSAFNLLVFLLLCSRRFLMKGLCAVWRNSTYK